MGAPLIVIGAGQAAAQLAVSLRQGGFADPIEMIGEERYAPYQRPPLSKKFFTERGDPKSLYLRTEKYWAEHNVTLLAGASVSAVDPPGKRVTLADGRAFEFSTLVFATGTSARAIPIPGLDLPGVLSLRGIDDALTLRAAVDAAKRVAVVGGGYIGLEFAAVLRGEGKPVTVLEGMERVLKRTAGEAVSAFYERFHRARGAVIHTGVRVAALEGEGRVSCVRLADGEKVEADLVLVATGSRANDDLAAGAGIACEDGIGVDGNAQTSLPNIYAIGDCSRFFSRRFNRRIRLENVQNAIDQAKAAAAAILGKPQDYDPVPWFWSDQYELKLQSAGLLTGYDDARVVGDPDSARFSVEYRQEGRLIAIDAINDAKAYITGRKQIEGAKASPDVGAEPKGTAR